MFHRVLIYRMNSYFDVAVLLLLLSSSSSFRYKHTYLCGVDSYSYQYRYNSRHHRSTAIPITTDRFSTLSRLSSSNNNIDTTCTNKSHIIFPGGGIYFYHQAGVINYLREETEYDLGSPDVTFCGASAGALTATLTAADVDFYAATELALALANQADVWDRRKGLQGIWGPLIQRWLEELLLPASKKNSIDDTAAATDDDAMLLRDDKVSILLTPVPDFLSTTKVSKFIDREDLIQCNLASVHLPWFMDGKLTSDFRGRPYIDGSFLSKDEDYYNANSGRSLPPLYDDTNTNTGSNKNKNVILVNWKNDSQMKSKGGGMDIVEALSPDGIYDLMEKGKRYGKIMDEQGIFDCLPKKKKK